VSGRCPREPKPTRHCRLRGGRIRAPKLPRNSPLYYLTHWHTFRTFVGALLGMVIALTIFASYSAQMFPIHPEDRLFTNTESADSHDPNVVIVGIDDASIQRLGHFPFSRDRFATVLDNLHRSGAVVTVFDIGFSEGTGGSGDDLFASAIGRDGPVVLAYTHTKLQNGSQSYVYTNTSDSNRPLDKFLCGNPKALPGCAPVAEMGSTAILLDRDNVVRRMPMFLQAPCVSDGGGRCTPGVLNPIAFVAYRQFLLQSAAATVPLQYTPQGATFGEAWPRRQLPVDDLGAATIGWTGGPEYMHNYGRYLSFSDVYNNNFERSKVDGKIVLIGAYQASGIQDEQKVAPAGANTNTMAGVEIHANVIQMLNSAGVKFIQPEPPAAVLLTLLVICVLLGVFLPRLSALYGLAATVGAAVVYTIAWIPLSVWLRVVPDLFHAWLAIGITYAALMAYRFLFEEREKRKVTSLFGQYLKPEIVESMARARSVEDIKIGGERKELSLLFVDIRGFTHMSESMEAQDVVRVIDLYLEELSQVVFRWDGTIDKYVGDEIMAFWNAPRDQPGHALLAVRCAWEMVARMPQLNANLVAQGLPEVRYGLGINTGPASIGIMGSQHRRTYTAIGDTVNTAARFCGAAGPTQILIGQRTFEECRDYLAVDMVPGVQLKGKSAEKFTIYRITAIREYPGRPWATVPGLDTYSEVGVYHQQTMIGAGATVALETGEPTTGQLLDTAEFKLPPEPAAPVG
jgi:adenylate cyclase